MKTKNSESRQDERNKALMEAWDYEFRSLNAKLKNIPDDIKKSISYKTIYEKLADKFFISTGRVKLIIHQNCGRRKINKGKQPQA
jgi:hypothetical protein